MDGALMEIGPFRLPNSSDKLELNPGSWHQHANLLFVDQPVGTGLSTAATGSYLHELPEMARDMMTFLERYFEIFPERQNDEYYLAGESFAGQYLPYLARAILDKNLNKTSPVMEILKPASDVAKPKAAKPVSSQSTAETSPTVSADSIASADSTASADATASSGPKEKRSTGPWVDLKAVVIGNGWIDPPSQYLTYLPFAYQSGLIKHGSDIAATIESKTKRCSEYFETHDNDRAGLAIPVCDEVLDGILRELFLASGLKKSDPNACVNVYDIRLRDTFSSCGMNWPPDLANVSPYLRRKDVLTALHVPDSHGWRECSGAVGSAFKAKHSNPSIKIIPTLIEDDIEVVMFNGDQDLICNHVGNEKLIQSLKWGQQVFGRQGEMLAQVSEESSGFRSDEPFEDWFVNGTAAGTIQTGRNLTYIKIFNASHMVPVDVPEVAQAMINQLIGVPGYSRAEQQPKPTSNIATTEEPSDDTKGDFDDDNDGGSNPAVPEDEAGESGESGEQEDATWTPYYKAGAFALVVVALVAAMLGMVVWRNRRLTQDALAINGTPLRRGVHYEDELEDYEAQQRVPIREEGFFRSILSGISRWHVPSRGGRSLRLNHKTNDPVAGKYRNLGANAPAGASSIGLGEFHDSDDENGVPLEAIHKRDSVDSILDELSEESHINK